MSLGVIYRADRFGDKDAIALAKMSSVLVLHSRAKSAQLAFESIL
jgi:hypothetical protein